MRNRKNEVLILEDQRAPGLFSPTDAFADKTRVRPRGAHLIKRLVFKENVAARVHFIARKVVQYSTARKGPKSPAGNFPLGWPPPPKCSGSQDKSQEAFQPRFPGRGHIDVFRFA